MATAVVVWVAEAKITSYEISTCSLNNKVSPSVLFLGGDFGRREVGEDREGAPCKERLRQACALRTLSWKAKRVWN